MKPLVVLVLSLLMAGCSPFDSQDGTPIEPPEVRAWVSCICSDYRGTVVHVYTEYGLVDLASLGGIDTLTGLADTAYVRVEGYVMSCHIKFLTPDADSVLYESIWCPIPPPLDPLDVTLTL